MRWRRWSERRWDRIAAEHVVMIPKTHGFTVDNQIVLHSLGLSAKLVIAADVGVERVTGVGIADFAPPQSRHGRLDGLPQRGHVAQ